MPAQFETPRNLQNPYVRAINIINDGLKYFQKRLG